MCELFTSPYFSGTAVSLGEVCIKRNIPIVPKLSVASKNCENVYPVRLGSETVWRKNARQAAFSSPLDPCPVINNFLVQGTCVWAEIYHRIVVQME